MLRQKNNPYWFDQFLENLQKHNPCDISVIDASFENAGTLNEEESSDVAKDTLTILREVVATLDTTHKNKLNDLLSELYLEALNTNDTVQGNG